MFELTLKSGTYHLNLDAITTEDVRKASNPKTKVEDSDAILAKALNIKPAEIEKLPYREYRRLVRWFWKCVSDPLADEDTEKNLQSEST